MPKCGVNSPKNTVFTMIVTLLREGHSQPYAPPILYPSGSVPLLGLNQLVPILLLLLRIKHTYCAIESGSKNEDVFRKTSCQHPLRIHETRYI